MFGVAFGQLLGGAVSDVKGRRTVALGGLGLYAAASLALALLQPWSSWSCCGCCRLLAAEWRQ